MSISENFKLVAKAVRNGSAESLQTAAELVVAESNLQALKYNLPELANAKAENLECKAVGKYLLVLLEFPESREESYWAWMSEDGSVTNLENEFVPPPINAVTHTRSHGATWRYYPGMSLGLREHFGV